MSLFAPIVVVAGFIAGCLAYGYLVSQRMRRICPKCGGWCYLRISKTTSWKCRECGRILDESS